MGTLLMMTRENLDIHRSKLCQNNFGHREIKTAALIYF